MDTESLRAALAAFGAGELPASSLMRALVTYDGWVVPAFASPEGLRVALTRTAAGEVWARAFTDAAALAASGTAPAATMRLDGAALVGLLRDDLAGLELDPGAPHAVRLEAERFASLRRWVAALEVEGILHGADDPHGLAKLREFDRYRLVVRELPEGLALVLAPDERGRKLAAVFTARDCVDAFVKGMKERGVGEMTVLRKSGTELFEELAAARLGGIVFNPAGPAAPKAVQHAFASVVLLATP